MRILLVDDDEDLMEVLASKLIEQRYAVDIASTGEMGREFILLFDFDLVVLDWVLPDIDGITLCQQLRAEGYTMPIMLLTARDRNTDKVMGLDAGADDYIVKPFDFEVLTARIRALMRREINITAPILQWRELDLDPKTHEVHCRQQLLPLTPKEYGLMELFMRHPQQVFSPGAIIDNLWAGEDPPGEEAVRTHIKGLRHKLKAVGMPKDTIKTVYGVGYRLKSSDDENLKTIAQPSNTQPVAQLASLGEIWSKFKDLAFQRVADLENLVSAGVEEGITSEIKAKARDSAHKLAGSLGCYGFAEGSRIAKKIEKLLWQIPLESIQIAEIAQFTASLNQELQHQPFEKIVEDALGKQISLLIIDHNSNPSNSQELVTTAENNGMKPYLAATLSQAETILQQQSIDAILHKITFPNDEDLEFLQQLHRNQPQLPMVAIAESAQLLDRLDIVRKGGNLTLQHPVKPQVAIDAVAELLQRAGAAAKVLIIDDDPQVLLSLEISLQAWGFAITTLDKSTDFWSVLEETKPDILVLDIDMPDLNGIELCQILRSDRQWQYLPVLFLSVHQDEKTQYQAFAIGADDYVCKPVTGSVLANRILNRLRRSQINQVF